MQYLPLNNSRYWYWSIKRIQVYKVDTNVELWLTFIAAKCQMIDCYECVIILLHLGTGERNKVTTAELDEAENQVISNWLFCWYRCAMSLSVCLSVCLTEWATDMYSVCLCTGWRKKTGPPYLIVNIMKIPWPNCVEIGELLQYNNNNNNKFVQRTVTSL